MSKFAQYLAEKWNEDGITFWCCTIHAQRESSSKTKTFAFDIKEMDTDIEDVFEHNDCLPNAGMRDIKKIIAKVKAGEIWVGDDVYGEGVVAFGPMNKRKEVSDAASQYYKSAYAYNGPGR